jgi:hypothetical protein
LGEGRFRLGRLLRGQVGTQGAISSHDKGEPFALIERSGLEPISLPIWSPGSAVRAFAWNGYEQCSLIPAFKGCPKGAKLKL